MIRLIKKVVEIVGISEILKFLSEGSQNERPEIMNKLRKANGTENKVKVIMNANKKDKEILRREAPDLVEKVEKIEKSQDKIESVIQRAKKQKKATF